MTWGGASIFDYLKFSTTTLNLQLIVKRITSHIKIIFIMHYVTLHKCRSVTKWASLKVHNHSVTDRELMLCFS